MCNLNGEKSSTKKIGLSVENWVRYHSMSESLHSKPLVCRLAKLGRRSQLWVPVWESVSVKMSGEQQEMYDSLKERDELSKERELDKENP